MTTNWHSDLVFLGVTPGHYLYPWLTGHTRLVATIRSICRYNTRVKLLSQVLAGANADEQAVLQIDEVNSLVRQIYILADEVPMVYARVVVPYGVYVANKVVFDDLGERPLGDTLLFNDPECRRSEFTFGMIEHLRDELVARRSVFSFSPGQLLITEAFLPAIAKIKY